MKYDDINEGDYVVIDIPINDWTIITGTAQHRLCQVTMKRKQHDGMSVCRTVVGGKVRFIKWQPYAGLEDGFVDNETGCKVRLATEAEVVEAMILAVGATNV